MDFNLAICVLCTKRADRNGIKGVLGNPEMCSLLTTATGNLIEPDPTLPDVLCRNCLLEANLHLEYQNRIYTNFMKLRINHYIRNSDHERARELKDRLKQSRPIYYMDPTTKQRCRSSRRLIDESLINALHGECSSTTNNNTSMIINDPRTIRGSPLSTSNTNFSYHTNDADISSVSSSSDSPEQRDVSSLLVVTHEQHESISVTESGGDLYLRSEQQTQHEVLHECGYCPKSYRRARYLEKHLRKHEAVMRAKSRRLSLSEGPTQYQCSDPECREKFLTLQLLRSHSKKHKFTYSCMTCPEKFTLKTDLSWHSAECEARQKVLNAVKDGVVDMKKPMRPRTRSVSIFESARRQSTSEKTVSCASSDVSIVDSLYLQRMARASKWRENIYEDDNTSVSVISDSNASSDASNHSSRERRKIRKDERHQSKAEKRKAKRLGVDFYKCSVCSFGCRSLSETMRHEQRYHRLLLNFYCKRCKDWYTTRENLIRHRKKHFEELWCDFCEEKFDSQFNLEHHMLLHYEKSFACIFCPVSFLKSVWLDEHLLDKHRLQRAMKPDPMIRSGKPYMTNTTAPFRRYESTILLQQPSERAKILPKRRTEPVLKISRTVHHQLGKAAGIRKPGINMCGEHNESFAGVESDDCEAGRQDCNATPSLYADYTVSPLCFDQTDDTETSVSETNDQMKADPDINPVPTTDNGVYNELEDMKVFYTEPLRASSDNAVAPSRNLESDVIIIDDSDDGEDNPAGCISLPVRQPHKKKRRILKVDLPITIGERFIPSYEEYVPTSRYLVGQIDNVPPLNRPFRYIT